MELPALVLNEKAPSALVLKHAIECVNELKTNHQSLLMQLHHARQEMAAGLPSDATDGSSFNRHHMTAFQNEIPAKAISTFDMDDGRRMAAEIPSAMQGNGDNVTKAATLQQIEFANKDTHQRSQHDQDDRDGNGTGASDGIDSEGNTAITPTAVHDGAHEGASISGTPQGGAGVRPAGDDVGDEVRRVVLCMPFDACWPSAPAMLRV